MKDYTLAELRKISEAYENMETKGLENSPFDINVLKTLTSFKKRLEYCKNNLQLLGRGSSRIVFKLPNGNALKLAYNRKGIAQNTVEEGDYITDGYQCFSKVYNASDDGMWIESELARKCKPTDFQRIMGMSFDTMCDCIVLIARQIGRGNEQQYHHFKNKALAEQIIERDLNDCDSFLFDLNDYIDRYDASSTIGDFLRIANWGIVNREGKDCCVIIDRGFNRDVQEQYY